MSVLCLTGWQQPADALKNIAPDAVHFPYNEYMDCNALFAALPQQQDCAIGWSLGGQLLARAVAGGHIRPRKLVLIASPFQWVADARFPRGIAPNLAGEAFARYRKEPVAMLRNLNTLIALGDSEEKTITRALNGSLELWQNGPFWFEQLLKTSCSELDFSAFPPTLLVHGEADKVIVPANSGAFAARIARAVYHTVPACAHAPQLHDASLVRQWVADV